VEELDSINLIKLLLHQFLIYDFDLGKVRKKKKFFIFAWSTKIVPDTDNPIHCPWLLAWG